MSKTAKTVIFLLPFNFQLLLDDGFLFYFFVALVFVYNSLDFVLSSFIIITWLPYVYFAPVYLYISKHVRNRSTTSD